MSLDIFDNLVKQLKDFQELKTVMFGGFGEPTFHKNILYMIGRIKSLGINVEMTSNGTLLNEDMVKGLFENRLDTFCYKFALRSFCSNLIIHNRNIIIVS